MYEGREFYLQLELNLFILCDAEELHPGQFGTWCTGYSAPRLLSWDGSTSLKAWTSMCRLGRVVNGR